MVETKQIVRLVDVDVKGEKPIFYAISQVRGISFNMAHAICNALRIDKFKKIGDYTDAEIKKIQEALKNPDVPVWMFNRRKDYETGKDIHLLSSDLKLNTEFDIKRMRKIKCYKGVRHSLGLPVRGQRTRAHFRGGRSIGVTKKKLAARAAKKE